VQVDFRAAGTEVPADKAGLAGLTRRLLDAGAGTLDEEAIANRVADLGAQLGGGADMDRASLSLRTLSSPAERDGAVELVATLIQQPRFPRPRSSARRRAASPASVNPKPSPTRSWPGASRRRSSRITPTAGCPPSTASPASRGTSWWPSMPVTTPRGARR
jgi:hypothetical protein